ncbi:MAG: lycopene cyclase family protein, partial [Erythrobacter sp.]|nr:lycopene cyclase family protein [Erythrobacter sp.]
AAKLAARARRHWGASSYYRKLGRMLFLAARPDKRYRVFERFYRLRQPLIERFYAGRSTMSDKARILAGRPPVPLSGALSALTGQAAPLLDPARKGPR